MKIFSWNVRGLNSQSRQRAVRCWISSNKPLVGAFLETRVREENFVSVLNSTAPGWRFENNYEHAELGRIWLVWDPSVSVIVFMKTDQLILCSIQLPDATESIAVAFIYGRNTELERRSLWEDLSTMNSTSPLRTTPWLLVGDLNQIASASEHYSIIPSSLPLRGMEDLQNCMSMNELVDLPSRGVFFTWSNHRPENPIIRKLDRAMVNDCWLEKFPDSYVFFDSPGDSDHAPALIHLDSSVHRGKKSFKYYSFLSSHPKFISLLREAWQEEICVGSAMFTLGERLKAAKRCCIKLNRLGFGNIQQRTHQALENLEAIQVTLMSAPSELLFRQEFVARKKWDFFAAAQESFYRQKSRIRWLKLGDANSKFFHKAATTNQAKNSIKSLRDSEGTRFTTEAQIKEMTVSYFKHILGQENSDTVPLSVDNIQALHPFRCSHSLGSDLSAIPSDEEIKAAIFSMPRNKAPGPDGFPLEFFLEAWDVVKDATLKAVKEFFVSGHLLSKFNATAITLIPKVVGADSLNQFRPVSCCSTVYKIISRIIGNKLKKFIPEAVQGNQVGFIKDRLLCENVLLASELVDGFHLERVPSRGCLQIDLSKAYDNVNWVFIINILRAFHLPQVFIDWIWVCISTTSYSIAFNGELIGFFHGKKGIRQGDPISSHLFALVMDVLAKKLDHGALYGRFIPHPKCKAPLITHLSFADDVLIFFDGSLPSLEGIIQILDEFKVTSGLGINRLKTSLFIDGGDFELNRMISDQFGVSHGSLPVRYLGVPLTSQKLRTQDYQPLLDKLLRRFNAWSVRHISFAGRL